MKKITLPLILFLSFLVLNSCNSDNEEAIDKLTILKKELNEIAKKAIIETNEFSGCNLNNPYDEYGYAFGAGLQEIVDKIDESLVKELNNTIDLNAFLNKIISNENFIIDTANVDLEFVSAVYKEFLVVYNQKELIDAIEISKEMEAYVLNSSIIDQSDKVFLLKVSSIIRHGSFVVVANQTSKKKTPLEICWIRELQELEDSGFFSQASCLISLPACMAIILADCLIEVALAD